MAAVIEDGDFVLKTAFQLPGKWTVSETSPLCSSQNTDYIFGATSVALNYAMFLMRNQDVPDSTTPDHHSPDAVSIYPARYLNSSGKIHPDDLAAGNQKLMLPVGFQDLVDIGYLSPRVVRVVYQLDNFGGIPDEDDRSALPGRFECILQLQQIVVEITKLAFKGIGDIERCLCYGLLAYATLLLPPGPLELGHHTIARLAFDKFFALTLTPDDRSNDCVVWSYMMLASTLVSPARTVQRIPKKGDCPLHTHIEKQDWPGTVSLLKKFFWTDDCLERGRIYWEQAIVDESRSGSSGDKSKAFTV